MYWELRMHPGAEVKQVYADAAEYGIDCRVQNLNDITQRLDRYLKKAKVSSKGLTKLFGKTYLGLPDGNASWYPWCMESVWTKEGRLTNEQGRLFDFELLPNRHYHLSEEAEQEVYAFPERQDIPYYFLLIKFRWSYEEDGVQVYADDDPERAQRESFFQGLLDCIGFPLVPLHRYGNLEERLVL